MVSRWRGGLCELRMDNIGILMPVVNTDPHLHIKLASCPVSNYLNWRRIKYTFRNVLNPAKILPPIQVEYFLSGGAKILIRISFTANRCTSCNSLSPNPLVNVLPPESTILPKSDFRRSRSVRLMASTTIWWMPGYSRPMISGSKRISGARNLSCPTYSAVSNYV